MATVESDESFDRDADGIKCHCGGYAERVDKIRPAFLNIGFGRNVVDVVRGLVAILVIASQKELQQKILTKYDNQDSNK